MKERSKNAARCRREKENTEFAELAKLLPLPASITTQLDKASVIRLTSSYLKMRRLFPKGLGNEWGHFFNSESDGILRELSSHLLQSLDGFVFVLSDDAKIIYISETASVHLGLSQVELTGNSIYEFIHSSDYDEMKSLLSYEAPGPPQKFTTEESEVAKSFCLRMKCILAKRNAGLASDGYKVIHCRGYLKLRNIMFTSSTDTSHTTTTRFKVVGIVAVGHPSPSTAITEIKMSTHSFMFRAGLDLTLLYLDSRVLPVTGYEPQHLTNKSYYKFVHPVDCIKLRQEHAMLLNKGQAITSYYRLLTHNGGWVWIQSLFILIHNTRASRQHCVLALNHLLSSCEFPLLIFDSEQLQRTKSNAHTLNGISTKRFRLSSPLMKNSKSHSKRQNAPMPLSSTENTFKNDYRQIQLMNLLPNETSSTLNEFPGSVNQNDLQLTTALQDFDHVMNSYHPNINEIDRHLTANISPGISNTFYNLMNQNFVSGTKNCMPINESESLTNTNKVNFESSNTVSNNFIPPKTELLPSNVIVGQFNTSYTQALNVNPSFSFVEELPHYVDPTQKWEPFSINSVKNNSDLICDTLNPNGSYEMEPNFIDTSKDISSLQISTGTPALNVEAIKDKEQDFTADINQNLTDKHNSNYFLQSSPYSNIYFGEVNNSIPRSTLPQVPLEPILPVHKSSGEQPHTLNDLSFTMSKALPSIISPNFLSTATTTPLSIPNLVGEANEGNYEQKHPIPDSPFDYSSGFCDYVNQTTLSSPSLSDSLCDDTKSRTSSDSLSEKPEHLEYQKLLPFEDNTVYYTTL